MLAVGDALTKISQSSLGSMYLTEKVKSSSRDQPAINRVEQKQKKTGGGNILIKAHAQAQELAAIVVAHRLGQLC